MRVGHNLAGENVAVEALAVDVQLVAEAAAALAIGPPDGVGVAEQRDGGEAFDFDAGDELPLEPGEDGAGAGADLVRAYLNEMGKEPLLNAEEEVELAKQIEAGLFAEDLLAQWENGGQPPLPGMTKDELQVIQAEGEVAAKRFLRANLRLVASIARRYSGRGMEFLDLIQEGNIGLVRAVQKFDYRLGYKFSTYATWWIRQTIGRAMASQGSTVRLPTHMFELVTKLSGIERALYQELAREPTLRELAREMDMTPEKVREIQDYARKPISLNTTVGPTDEMEFGDLVEDADVPEPVETSIYAAMRADLEKVLDTLTPREQQIIRLRYGLNGGEPRSLREVADAFNLSRERIRQIENIIMKKLRHPSRTELLYDYYN